MKFKVGQTVMLINRVGMSALIGSTAIIERVGKEFLYVTWLTHQSQSDGAYYLSHFKPTVEKNQQLLFAFMN